MATSTILESAQAMSELGRYASLGYIWFAPGVAVAETLYILCGKFAAGLLSATEYDDAINLLEATMRDVFPPPSGDKSLIRRSADINNGFGCSRSADGIYIALAEQLARTTPTVLLTFDQGLPKQAARNAPTVNVQLL
jgi:hypothetical protein